MKPIDDSDYSYMTVIDALRELGWVRSRGTGLLENRDHPGITYRWTADCLLFEFRNMAGRAGRGDHTTERLMWIIRFSFFAHFVTLTILVLWLLK